MRGPSVNITNMSPTTQPNDGSLVTVEILDNGNLLNVCWPELGQSRFHAVWLRDNGQDSQTRDASNYQKLITLNDIPVQTLIDSAIVLDGDKMELVFNPDGWSTVIGLEWLWERRYDREPDRVDRICPPTVTTWGAEFANSLPRASYLEAKSDPHVLLDWLSSIDRYGTALLDDVQVQSEAVLDVISLFGPPRETNYGRYFEIKAQSQPTNLANTSLGLQVHTDNPYRDPVPTLQFFGCLQNDAQGGDSVIVDGFRAAELLRKASPSHFELLTKHSAQFDFHGGKNAHLRATRPILECSPEGELLCVRFNNRSADAFTQIPFERMQEYYEAYRHFAELLTSGQLEVSFKLNAGQLFVTDNTRVLHGRKGFSGSGLRWMQGAYADKDALKSKILLLQRELSVGDRGVVG